MRILPVSLASLLEHEAAGNIRRGVIYRISSTLLRSTAPVLHHAIQFCFPSCGAKSFQYLEKNSGSTKLLKGSKDGKNSVRLEP